MPKEKKIPEEDEEPEEDESEEPEDSEEESGLEEEIEEDSHIEDFQFREFIQPTESAPVLEKIAGAPRIGFSLSGWESLSTPEATETGEEGDPFKYSVGGGGEEGETKYVSTTTQLSTAPTHVDFEKVGRRPDTTQEAAFTSSSEVRDASPPAQEKYEPARRMDVEKAGRRDPLETEERKYDPHLSSSK
jgi:hypothetical protein